MNESEVKMNGARVPPDQNSWDLVASCVTEMFSFFAESCCSSDRVFWNL